MQLNKPSPAMKADYSTSPTKRRTADEMAALLASILGILDGEEGKITIRHLFYRLTVQRVIPKTEAAYKGLCGHLAKWRRSEAIRWDAFADNTRWHIRHRVFASIEDALRNTVENYRRNLWETQPYYVEVWVEKDAMAAIVANVAGAFGVPVFVCRGFASLSSLYSAANTFREATKVGKRALVFHLGDYDPSGVAAGEAALRTFREDFQVDLEFVRIAVTEEQIRTMNLPRRPTKMTDSRAAKWTGGESVELDAMPPSKVRSVVERCITDLIDGNAWNALRQTEKMERETLERITLRPRPNPRSGISP